MLHLQKQEGFDAPTRFFWGDSRQARKMDRPALSLERQLFLLAKYCLSINVAQAFLEVHALDSRDAEECAFEVDLIAASRLPDNAEDISSAVGRLDTP
jgi:hypothetical protein